MTDFPNIPHSLRELVSNAGTAVLAVVDSWCSIRHGQLIPDRQDFDPATVARHLGKVYLYRFDPDLVDFVCRLAGEDINDAWEERIKGKSLKALVGAEHYAEALTRWRAVIDQPLIQYGQFSETVRQRQERVGERMLLPMRGPSGRGEFILGVADYKVSQADRSWVKPVWDDVIKIPCSDVPQKVGTDA